MQPQIFGRCISEFTVESEGYPWHLNLNWTRYLKASTSWSQTCFCYKVSQLCQTLYSVTFFKQNPCKCDKITLYIVTFSNKTHESVTELPFILLHSYLVLWDILLTLARYMRTAIKKYGSGLHRLILLGFRWLTFFKPSNKQSKCPQAKC